MKPTILALALALASCAQTVLYENGQPVARFQGDMHGVSYHRTPDGSIDWQVSDVDHSAATTAQGRAAAGKAAAIGAAVAASGLTSLLAHP